MTSTTAEECGLRLDAAGNLQQVRVSESHLQSAQQETSFAYRKTPYHKYNRLLRQLIGQYRSVELVLLKYDPDPTHEEQAVALCRCLIVGETP